MKEEIRNNENMETKVEAKPKKKKTKIVLILILILIAIAIGLFVGYKKVVSNPLSIYKNVINEVYDLANNYLEENLKDTMDINLQQEPVMISSRFTIDSNVEELAVLSDYEYELATGLDLEKEQINVSFGLHNDNEQIINLLMLFLNDHTYLKSDELYNQVLDLGLSNLDFSELEAVEGNYTYEDLDIILKNMKKILINSLDKNKFSLSDEEITINEDKIKAKKFTYLLDQENMERTINYIREEILKNEELMTSLSNVSGLTTEELEEGLKSEINYDDYEDIYIHLYTNGTTKVIAGNIGTEDTNVIRFTNKDDIFDMLIGDEYTNFIVKYENNELEISYNEYDEEIFNFTMINEKSSSKIEMAMNDYSGNINLSLETSNLDITENSISGDYILTYQMIDYYNNEESFTISGDLIISKEELESIDPSDSVNVENLSDEEMNVLYENLMNVLEKLNLSNYLEL